MKAMLERIPLHRLCTPEEVAAAVVISQARSCFDHRAGPGARRRIDGGLRSSSFERR
jgi:hypothetical protein